jgi:hypothetical protein
MFVESDGALLIGLAACGVQYSGIAAGGRCYELSFFRREVCELKGRRRLEVRKP